MSTPQKNARLHVLLSKNGNPAVVIRRGPTRRVCVFRWNRENDTFDPGQWLIGRIYERRSDVSPDGRYLIYFALNGAWDSESKGAWTAVSRVPYLKALAFYPNGSTWHGGGFFVGTSRYIARCSDPLWNIPEIVRDFAYDAPNLPGVSGLGDWGVYPNRLIRDGWRFVGTVGDGMAELVIFERELRDGWVLRRQCDHDGRDWHVLENLQAGQYIPCLDWEWADLDRDRLVWAALGKLFAGRLGDDGLAEVQELRDFNGDRYARIQAPY